MYNNLVLKTLYPTPLTLFQFTTIFIIVNISTNEITYSLYMIGQNSKIFPDQKEKHFTTNPMEMKNCHLSDHNWLNKRRPLPSFVSLHFDNIKTKSLYETLSQMLSNFVINFPNKINIQLSMNISSKLSSIQNQFWWEICATCPLRGARPRGKSLNPDQPKEDQRPIAVHSLIQQN